MKKFLLSVLAMSGMFGMAYAGTGTLNDPYTVDEVVAMGSDANLPKVYVEGYIVGFINGMSYTNAVFGLPTADENQTNLILGESSNENDIKYCLPVQLPAGDVRTNLNLWKNPNVLGHKVILGGDIIKYFGQIGIKNTSSYQWIGEAPELGTGGGGNTGGNTGGNDDDAYLVNGMDDFTIDNVNLPSDLSYIWSWDATYGAKASAYYESTNYAAEAYLISPALTVSTENPNATFSQALNFLNGNNRADYVNVCVREGEGAWETVEVSAWPAGNNWGFIDNCVIDLSSYAGKTIQIAFHYTSSSSCAPTWEVKRLVVGAEVAAPNPPADLPTGTCIAYVADGYSYSGNATQTVVISGTQDAGQSILDKAWDANDVCSLVFTQNNNNVSYVTGGAIRWYKNDEMTITPVEGVTITGMVLQGINNYSPENNLVNTNTGSWSYSDLMAVWKGNATSAISFANNNQIRWQYLEVYYNIGAGVDSVLGAGDAEAVYYNLQGVKVNNPEKGIFIKVQGGKSVKVVK